MSVNTSSAAPHLTQTKPKGSEEKESSDNVLLKPCQLQDAILIDSDIFSGTPNLTISCFLCDEVERTGT